MEALLPCPPFPLRNLPSFTVESTLISLYSRFDFPLSHQGAALAHLDSLPPHDLVLWTDGSVPFPFGKGGSGVLSNCSLSDTEATISFSAGPVCSSFSAEACAIVHALCWSRQHQQVCHFSSLLLLSDSRSVLATLSSTPSFLLPQTLWQELSSLSSCFIKLQWVPGHFFLPGNNAADEVARRGALLVPSAIPCSLSSLISRIHSHLSRTGGVLSHLNPSTHRYPRFPLRNLCSFVTLAVSSLVYAATNSAYCQTLISLGLAESRILHAVPADTRPRTPLISFFTV